ncbi:MAG TPA: response regulator [Bryobacteraceae bacterium]|jgi:FixJ family two-component response regulator|nr:response regulator [Bryobacteraceae bacterium]
MKTGDPIVFVVDDDYRVRRALCSLIESVGFQVAGFDSGSAFLAFEKPDAPACLVLDLNLPDINGLEVQEELLAGNAPPIIFISAQGDVPSSVQAMKAGAIDFLSKPFRERDLLRAIEAGIAADTAARRRREEVSELQHNYALLTPREREVFRFVAAGFANKEAAADLGISDVTIGVHRSQVMRKMKARSLAELVRMADKIGVALAAGPSK